MCKCEQNRYGDFVVINGTKEYSGIEMAINCQGMLRVRYYMYNDIDRFESQDILNVKHCPLCGRKFNQGR